MSNTANLSDKKFTGKVSKKERQAQKATKRSIECNRSQPISEKTLALQKQIKLLREGAKPHFIPSLEAAQASLNKLLED